MSAFTSSKSPHWLIAGVFAIALPDGWAVTNLPTSSTTLNLQTLSPTETSFVLDKNTSVSTSQGNGINGDASRNWQLTLQGVVDAAGSGVSLSSVDGQTTLTNFGTITGRGTGASDGGVVLLNGGKLVNHVGGAVTIWSFFPGTVPASAGCCWRMGHSRSAKTTILARPAAH